MDQLKQAIQLILAICLNFDLIEIIEFLIAKAFKLITGLYLIESSFKICLDWEKSDQ